MDGDYKLLCVDVGQNGSSSDAPIFNQCELIEAIEDRMIGFPPDDPLPKDDRPMPYFILGDDTFALKTWLMKPFSQPNMTDEQRIFNYRLPRSRQIVDNTFGILANRFQCLLGPLRQQPEMVKSIVLAYALLDHNDDQHHVIPGEWRNSANMQDVDNQVGGNRTTRMAKKQREYFKLYFNSPTVSVP